MTKIIQYRNCTIYYDPSPIPDRSMDYEWVYNDFDGSLDHRYGYCSSLDACKEAIDEVLDD